VNDVGERLAGEPHEPFDGGAEDNEPTMETVANMGCVPGLPATGKSSSEVAHPPLYPTQSPKNDDNGHEAMTNQCCMKLSDFTDKLARSYPH